MQKGLRNAGIDVSEVDYINAHGTATEANDVVETKAIKAIFGEKAHRLAVSSTKPVTGHLMGAAGAIETIVCALSIHRQEIPLYAQPRGAGAGVRSRLREGGAPALPHPGGHEFEQRLWRQELVPGTAEIRGVT